jgi:ribonucleoside-triphosphate reductase
MNRQNQMIKISRPSFSLDSSFLSDYKGKQPEWGPLGYITYKRTYSRKIDPSDPDSPTEEWWQTCKRVVEGTFSIQKNHCEMHLLPWKKDKAQRTAQKMFEAMWNFKFLPPGRGLWSMGTETVQKIGSMSLQNCAFVSTQNIHSEGSKPFEFLMDCLMLGVGVGFDTRGAMSVQIHRPSNFYDDNKPIFKVPDTREGWVAAVKAEIDAWLSGGPIYEYDYSEVRPAGEPIRGFGGVASGPGPLKALIKDLRKLYHEYMIDTPCYITSELIVDTCNMIGRCVVAGNIRRSAMIALGDQTDKVFAELKQDLHKLTAYRWSSNNSIIVEKNDVIDYDYHSALTATNGEPGYFWIDTARSYGRMKDPSTNKDNKIMGVNPCGEQLLESYETCCLVELYISRHDSLSDFLETVKLAYLYGKTVTLVPTHWPETNSIVLRNRRIGTSQTGITNAFAIRGKKETFRWCDVAYDFITGLDKQYSQWLCVPESIKKTSVKPSGTLSLLPPNINSGIHYGPSKYYIRRIRLAKNSPIAEALELSGYNVEQDVTQEDTVVAEFPVCDEFYTRGEDDVSMWEQLENAAQYQYWWSDNSVSVTIKVTKEEAKDIKYALELYENRLKSVSFLPKSDHGYDQAPIEPINETRYNQMLKCINEERLYRLLSNTTEEASEVKNLYCEGDKCDL